MGYSRNLLLVLVISVVLVLSALLVKAQTNAGNPSNEVTVTTTAALSGTTPIPAAVLVGNRLTIDLPSNKTTGFSWKLANEPNRTVLRLEKSEYNAPSSGGTVGQGGTETWVFLAVGRGTQTITMQYTRPWEKNAQPAKTQVFNVVVQ